MSEEESKYINCQFNENGKCNSPYNHASVCAVRKIFTDCPYKFKPDALRGEKLKWLNTKKKNQHLKKLE